MATKTKTTCRTDSEGTKPSAREMRAFFQRVRTEAKRYASRCDLSPNAIAEIAKAKSSSARGCTIFCLSPYDPISRAHVLAAFTYAATLYGGNIYYDSIEDVGGMMIIYLTRGALP